MINPENEKTEKNRKLYAQKLTVDQQKIRYIKENIENRRNQVYQLSLQGYSNNEISKELQVSLSTIEKDLHYMRWHCLKWTQDIVASNAKKPMFDSYTRIEIAQKELGIIPSRKGFQSKKTDSQFYCHKFNKTRQACTKALANRI